MKDTFFFIFAISGLLIGFGLPGITLLLTWITPKRSFSSNYTVFQSNTARLKLPVNALPFTTLDSE